MKKYNQKGFGAIESLLILIVVLMIGSIGYYVYHSQQQTNKTLTSAQSESAAPASVKKSTNTTQSPQQYMTIKEWGVRVKVSADTSSLYYYMSSQNSDNAYISFKTISDIAPDCAADKISLGVIFRQTIQQYQDAVSSPSDTGQPGTIKIGSYYYGFSHPQAACDDGTATMEAAISKAQPNTNIADIFKTIETAP